MEKIEVCTLVAGMAWAFATATNWMALVMAASVRRLDF